MSNEGEKQVFIGGTGGGRWGLMKMLINGEEVGQLNSFGVKTGRLDSSNENVSQEPQARLDLNNIVPGSATISMDYSQLETALLAQLVGKPNFDIVVTKKGMPKNRYKMTKNRRIRKKWLKKYGPPKTVTYNDCYISGHSEVADFTADFTYLSKKED